MSRLLIVLFQFACQTVGAGTHGLSFDCPAEDSDEGWERRSLPVGCGLCARGGFEVDCEWEDGEPTKVAVRSLKGLKPDIRFRGRKVSYR